VIGDEPADTERFGLSEEVYLKAKASRTMLFSSEKVYGDIPCVRSWPANKGCLVDR
jgi:hypothetical protein